MTLVHVFGMGEIVSVGSNPQRLEAFEGLIREYQAWLPEDLRVPNLEEEVIHLVEHYGCHALLLGYQEDRPVGCVVLSRRDEDTAEIKRLYVAPAARGTGMGRALAEAAIAGARAAGHRRIVLDTHRNRLEAAYALYRALGFQECEAYGEADYACPTFLALSLE
ncbi:MAG TPA: GNAT family N-acetyltransferase [Candidatus Baltobacteraceae bacterium]|nr:GNAT family N-acetyltransferase [Candidatus Baltobacteraceae bacterium]